jgi:CRISPR-associated protein Csb2
VGYRLATDPPPPPLAAFALLAPDAARLRAFHPVRHTRRLVGMLRDAVARSAQDAGWPHDKIASFVLGHAEPPGQPHRPVQAPRLAYLPLPSLQPQPDSGASARGAARRVLITSLQPAAHRDIALLRRALAGCELINPHSGLPEAILSPLPRSDRVLRTYVPALPAHLWATVTPLILPGHDDRNPQKTDALLRKAILQAGFPQVLARHARIEWSLAGFWPGADLATRYAVPDYLRPYPRFHVRILWQDARGQPLPLHGPICLGGGRFLGLGLFAACQP